MLHVTRLTDRSGRYYLDDLATELGLAGPAATAMGPGVPGRWTGPGAAGLGLGGCVRAAELEAVLCGRNPSTGRALVARPGAVSAYDLTFSAPKSVSLLFALGSPEVAREVTAAHAGAVDSAMGYVSRRAMAVRRGSGDGRTLAPAAGAVGAAFTHGVSRALDPHLHTHVVVANMGHGEDGRWTAVDGRGLFAHAAAAGQLYESELRHRLTERLGVGWTMRGHGGHDVAGVDPAVVGAFSARAAEIRGHVAGRGSGRQRGAPASPGGAGAPGVPGRMPGASPSRRALGLAWAVTRDPKGAPPTPEGLARRWRAQAWALGFDAVALGRVIGRDGSELRATDRPAGAAVDEHRFAARLYVSPHTAVTRRDVVAAWAAAVHGGSPATEVERCADQLAGWSERVGVAESREPLAAVLAPPHHLRALGPRPVSPASLGVWLEAARDVDRYRSRWGVGDSFRPLGLEGSGRDLACLPVARLADHLSTEGRVDDARRRLGRGLGREGDVLRLSLGRG